MRFALACTAFGAVAALTFVGCKACTPLPKDRMEPSVKNPSSGRTTFESDASFLRAHGELVILESPGGGRVAVSPKYQGRVMTSAVLPDADSLGWIHRAFIEGGKTGTPFDNYGGEDRFWLGPEGGQFGLYFPPGKPFAFDNWQTPAAFQEGAWDISHRSPTSVGFTRKIAVTNYGGQAFTMDVTREIGILTRDAVVERLGIALDDHVQWAAPIGRFDRRQDRADELFARLHDDVIHHAAQRLAIVNHRNDKLTVQQISRLRNDPPHHCHR